MMAWNFRQVSQIRDKIRSLNPNRSSLLESFTEAMNEIGHQVYQFEVSDPVSLKSNYQTVTINDVKEIHFRYSLNILDNRMKESGSQITIGHNLEYRWQSPVYKGGVKVQNLIISMSRISNLRLQILNENTIFCSFIILNFNESEDYDQLPNSEYIYSKSPMDIHQGLEEIESAPCSLVVDKSDDEDEKEENQSESMLQSYPVIEDWPFCAPKVLKYELLPDSGEVLFRIRING